MNCAKIGIVCGALVSLLVLAGALWAGAVWSVNYVVKDHFVKVNTVIASQGADLYTAKKKHDKDIEVIAGALDWTNWKTLDRRLKNGGSLSDRECREYRYLSKKFGMVPRPC